MARFSKLANDIIDTIAPNGNGLITGQTLQDTLLDIVDSVEAELDNAEATAQATSGKVATIESDLQTETEKIRTIEGKLQNVTTEAQKNTSNVATISNEVEAISSTLQNVQSNLKVATNDLRDVEEEVSTLGDVLQSAEGRVGKLESDVRIVNSDIQRLDSDVQTALGKANSALQSVPSEYVTENELSAKDYATTSQLNNKVDKVAGKGLSTEDFTTELKAKLEGLNDSNTGTGSGDVSDILGSIIDEEGYLYSNGEKVDMRFTRSLLPVGTAIPANANLNTIQYLKIGKYYCSLNADAKTITNCPVVVAFSMEVFNPLGINVDDETTKEYTYRLRVLTQYDTGQSYIQFCKTSGTAGKWTYGDWYVSVRTKSTLNSSKKGSTSALGSATQGVYVDSTGTLVKMTYTLGKSVPSSAVFTDTNTKVTAVGNHYAPAEDESVQINAPEGEVVIGLKRDAAGHVVGVVSAMMASDDGEVSEDKFIWVKEDGEAGVRLKGTNGTATGNLSISAGDDKTASDGTAFASAASGDHAVVFGFGNTCAGRSTLAQGLYNTVNGKDSVAFGQRNTVNGDQAFAVGQQNEVTTRLGVTLGYQNKATNTNSIAIGYKNTSGGSGSVALGDTCESNGTSSTAMGYKTKATGAYTSTFGQNTQATNNGEVAMGSYNNSTTSTDTAEQTSFSFGIGTSDTNRVNALEIKKNGDVYIGDKLLNDFITTTEMDNAIANAITTTLNTAV